MYTLRPLSLLNLALCATTILASVIDNGRGPGHGGPGPNNPRKCRKIEVRKEWRQLSKKHRREYIQSVLCLQRLPPSVQGGVAKNRYDEFHGSHALLTDRIHYVGQFFPWHRQLVTLYSNELRERCGYKGPTPYWDWTIDADDTSKPITSSVIFDPVTGFGGDGVPGTFTLPDDPANHAAMLARPFDWKGCIADGPFKDLVLSYGPGRYITDHCLVRNFNESVRSFITSDNVNEGLAKPTFQLFEKHANSLTGYHFGGHIVVGGELGDAASSPGDPLFYLHHAALDRVWWKWQQLDPANRLYDISGPTTRGGNDTVTPDFVLDFPTLGGNVTIREVMDVSKEPGCFRYT